MPGVTVGENAVVGAMSFVNCDIPDNCVAVGVPVKIINPQIIPVPSHRVTGQAQISADDNDK